MICLVRHGEAAASWGGHPDPGLSELGQRQAESVATELQAMGMLSGISSPMQRCQETSEPFMKLLGQMPEIVPEVSEVVTPADVGDRVVWLKKIMSGTWDEAGAELIAWQSAMIERVSNLPDNTVVFSHFVAINAIVSGLRKDPNVLVFRPNHCSITKLQKTENGLLIESLGSESETRVL